MRLADEALEFVIDAARLAHVAGRRLQRDRGRAVRRQFKEERVRIRSEFFKQPLLHRMNKSRKMLVTSKWLVGWSSRREMSEQSFYDPIRLNLSRTHRHTRTQ